jgi:[ribosomal protein S18]-alanine N-acetyltransferase
MRRLSYSPRPATEDDLEQVAEIERLSIQPPWTRAAFASELSKNTSKFWVITDDATDEKVLAYAVIHFPAEQAHLVTFAVHPEFRRSGLGKYLIRRLLHYVIRRGGTSIVLEVRKGNSAAIQLYQGLGFIVIHTLPRFYPDGEDAFSMIFKATEVLPVNDPIVDFDSDSDNTGGGGKPTLN